MKSIGSLLILIIFLFCSIANSQTAYNITVLDSLRPADTLSWTSGDRCSGIWGWENSQTGNQYALMGLFNRGWGLFDVSDPNNISIIGDTLPGERLYELKTCSNYAYTANKGSRSHDSTDLRIFNLYSNPPLQVGRIPVAYSSGHEITRIHDLHIEDSVMYLACEDNTHKSSNDTIRYPNLFMFDLSNDPTDPDSIGSWFIPEDIIHDSDVYGFDPFSDNRVVYPSLVEVYVKDSRIYMACGSSGIIVATFYDSTDAGGQLHRIIDEDQTWRLVYRNVRRSGGTLPARYRTTHTIKVTDDHKYIFVTDEALPRWRPDPVNQAGVLRMFDISHIEDLTPISQQLTSDSLDPIQIYEAPEDSAFGRIVSNNDSLLYPNYPPNSIHKVFLHEGFAYLSYYTKGLRILDISDPENWIEAGLYNTPGEPFLEPDTIWNIHNGSWGVYPYFGPEKILLSDHDGLRTFRFGEADTIDANTTWSGRKYITGDVVVDDGATLTVSSGTIIKFLDGKKLTVNGNIQFNGTAQDSIKIFSMRGQTGYGIQVQSTTEPAGASVDMSYCVIRDLSVGVEVINADLDIDHSDISGCAKGISLNNATADISNNSIESCTYGIYVDGSSPDVTNNDISNCSPNGIYVLAGAGTYLENSITDCGIRESINPGGFYAVDGATPILEDDGEYALNAIQENTTFGIKADEESHIYAGKNDGGNSIYDNSDYDAVALDKSTIDALYCWWGTEEPDTSQFYSNGSMINYDPWLEEDPFASENLWNPKIREMAESGESGKSPSDLTGENRWRTKLLYYLRQKNHTKLLALGDSLLKTMPSTDAVSELISVMQHSSLYHKDKTYISYLQSISKLRNNNRIASLCAIFLIENYLQYGQINKAIQTIENVRNRFPGSEAEVFALLKTFHVFLHYNDDADKARQAYSALSAKYPEHSFTQLAKIELDAASGIIAPQKTRSLNKQNANPGIETLSGLPKVYRLQNNYPNPFNPVTHIKYQLPKASQVNIDIYNILGQRVRSLVNRREDADYYTVAWNGMNDNGQKVGSGIYIYRIVAKSLSNNESFVSSKKMLMVK